MKIKTILLLVILLFVGAFSVSHAQTVETRKVRINKQTRFAKSNLSIKFLSLIEDSRCPKGTNCIWAGNAKIKISVAKGKIVKTFQLNSAVGPKEVKFQNFQIEFIDLTPAPQENIRINKNSLTATIAVRRL